VDVQEDLDTDSVIPVMKNVPRQIRARTENLCERFAYSAFAVPSIFRPLFRTAGGRRSVTAMFGKALLAAVKHFAGVRICHYLLVLVAPPVDPPATVYRLL
jgi:hypothetical protein